MLTINLFDGGRRHITGNRCEKGLGGQKTAQNGPNVPAYKLHRMFDYPSLEASDAPMGEIGVPRVLNMYENYPFWATLLGQLGFPRGALAAHLARPSMSWAWNPSRRKASVTPPSWRTATSSG